MLPNLILGGPLLTFAADESAYGQTDHSLPGGDILAATEY